MHAFQPVDTKEIDFNAFRMIGDDGYVVTTKLGDKINAVTANLGGLGVMWGKNCVFIVLKDSSYSKELIDQSETFSINFLDPAKYRTTMRYLGAASGRAEDKLAAMKLNVNYWNEVAFLDEARTVLCARKIYKGDLSASGIIDESLIPKWYERGDHHILYMGEILQVLAR